MSHPAPQVLMIDGGHGVGPALEQLLADAGLDVSGWDGAAAEPLARADAAIFNLPDFDEAALLGEGRLADTIDASAARFMDQLQQVARAMFERGRGQIWVLGLDDSFAYYLPLPVAPVSQHLRVGAVRALAKEAARFGVSANAAILQPGPETVEAAALQAARTGLASYAQRFRPTPLAEVAQTLAFWLGRERLPMNGSVLHFGSGVYDGNL